MKIVDRDRKYPAFDAPNGLAHILISAGLADEFNPAAPDGKKPILQADTRWEFVRATVTAPPSVEARCACMSRAHHFESDDPSTFVFRHQVGRCDGGIEPAPESIVDEYLCARAVYYRARAAAASDPLAKKRAELKAGSTLVIG